MNLKSEQHLFFLVYLCLSAKNREEIIFDHIQNPEMSYFCLFFSDGILNAMKKKSFLFQNLIQDNPNDDEIKQKH